MTVEKEFPITKAKIQRHDKKTMIFRVGIGEGEVDGEKFDISTNASNGDPTWYFSKEARYYTVPLKALTEDVLAAREMRNEIQ